MKVHEDLGDIPIAAKDAGVTSDEKAFEEAFKKVATQKPKPEGTTSRVVV